MSQPASASITRKLDIAVIEALAPKVGFRQDWRNLANLSAAGPKAACVGGATLDENRGDCRNAEGSMPKVAGTS